MPAAWHSSEAEQTTPFPSLHKSQPPDAPVLADFMHLPVFEFQQQLPWLLQLFLLGQSQLLPHPAKTEPESEKRP